MKKYIKQNTLALVAVSLLAFSGCGEDRSHPKNNNGGQPGYKITYADPIAVIDINGTTNLLQSDVNDTLTYRLDNTNTNNPFIVSGLKSQDMDENNQSIVAYDWNITSTFSAGCLDINNTGSVVRIKTCDEAFNDGDINITLIVTDDENKTASANKLIKIN